MPIYIPTITSFINNIVNVVSIDSTSYEAIINSMGSYYYEVTALYLKANNNNQILESFTFKRYDVNGTLESFAQIPTIDPYQYQISKNIKLERDNVVLDGRTNLDFTLLPFETLFLIFSTNQIANKDLLPETDFLNNDFFNLFNDYKEEL